MVTGPGGDYSLKTTGLSFGSGVSKPDNSTPITSTPAASTPAASKPDEIPPYDVMSDLELKAEMNKALGFTKSTSVTPENTTTDYAAIDAQLAASPKDFVKKYLTLDVQRNAFASATVFDAELTVMTTLSPERQAAVIAGFSQRNEAPRAYTGEFLDLFTPSLA